MKFDEYCKVLFVPSREIRHFRIMLLKANDGENQSYYCVSVETRVSNGWFEIIELGMDFDNKEEALSCIKDYRIQINQNLEQIMQASKRTVEANGKIIKEEKEYPN